MAKIQLVEIARSFSYKLNIPGQYESRDFFCSQKAEVPESEAEITSNRLYEFCRNEVLKSVKEYKELMNKPKVPSIAKIPTVSEYEAMTPEEQKVLKDAQLASNRAKYAENKKVGFIKRERCADCEMWVKRGEKCPRCESSAEMVPEHKQK